MSKPKNKRWRLLRTGAAALACLFASHNFAATPPTATIVSLEGKGEFREPQQIDWRPAKVNQSLFPSNLVRTGDQSKMAVMFPDRTQVRLAQNSVLQIKELGEGKNQKTILNLNAGRSWMQSKTTPGGLSVQTPSAVASIRGTDWELVVEPDGRSTLTVFSGEAEFSNAEGSVAVAKNEQATAEKGRAPVKVQVINPRERIQWVSSITIDPRRYREMAGTEAQIALDAVTKLVEAGDTLGAREKLAATIADRNTDSTSARLLLADFQLFDGDAKLADETLAAAATRYPLDERVPIARAKVAQLQDNVPAARQHLATALQLNPKSADAWVARGDFARFEGVVSDARAAYREATTLAPDDARGWLGLGMIEAERENIASAREFFERALARDAKSAIGATTFAERGSLETSAGDFDTARKAFDQALSIQPDNVAMLTGKAVLELKQGNTDAALELLLRANLIEPRYARARLYLAVVYYRMERPDRALAELARVKELDANDPLSHFMASLMWIDTLEPGAAVVEAREAVRLMPYLKSLNQLANNQAGGANLGNAMSFFGMENWARHMAQESYLPLWAGSHLFLADRYAGDFSRRSELLQGFLLDPSVFGASNRSQSLVSGPGHYAALSMRSNRSDDFKLVEPVATFNGTLSTATPITYFAEVIDTRIRPGSTNLAADAKTYTLALGIKPRWDIGLFAYANRLSADIDIGTRDVTGLFQRVQGHNSRVDAGGHLAIDADAQLWFKAGHSDERSTVDERASLVIPGLSLVRQSDFITRPRADDAQLRFTRVTDDGRERWFGVEGARLRTGNALQRDASIHLAGTTVPRGTLDATDRDRSTSAYAGMRFGSEPWRIEGSLGFTAYRKDRQFHVVSANPVGVADLAETFERNRASAALGTVYRYQPGQLLRAACQAWTRPASPGTLAPSSVAGIVIDDQLVFPGGKSTRCRSQLEWELSPQTFVSANLDYRRIDNLASTLDGVLNTRADVTNLDRLRNRLLPLPPKPDALEDTPIFSRATVQSAGIALEHLLTRNLAARVNYHYTDSANTYDAFRGKHVPYLPQHSASIGATWTVAQRSYVSAQGVYRSVRFSDETNQTKLPPGWDMQLRAYVEFDRKHWTLEAYALNLLKKDASDVFGVIATYRF